MTSQQITINGKPVSIIFNMSTVLEFEDIAGYSYFSAQFKNMKERLNVILAAIRAADSNTEIKIEDLKSITDWNEISAAYVEVMTMAGEFFHVPILVAESEQKESDGQEEEQPKNV